MLVAKSLVFRSGLLLNKPSALMSRVFRKQVNVSPGFKFDQSIYFSVIAMFFNEVVLCSLRLFTLKPEGQTT